jgi:hypothetical protein
MIVNCCGRVEVLLNLAMLLENASSKCISISAGELEELDYDAQLQLFLERLVAAEVLPRGARPAALSGIVRVFSACTRTRYSPQKRFPGEIVIIQADDEMHGSARALEELPEVPRRSGFAVAWEPHGAHVSSIFTTGNHMTLLQQPHVGKIARQLRRIWQGAGLRDPATE